MKVYVIDFFLFLIYNYIGDNMKINKEVFREYDVRGVYPTDIN